MLVTRVAVVVAVAALVVAVSAEDNVKVSISGDDAISSGFKVFMRLYNDCARKDAGLTGCIKMKAITFFDRVARAGVIPLTEDVQLVKREGVAAPTPKGRALTEAELEATLLSDNSEAREFKLDNILMDTVARFFNSHTLLLQFPKVDGNQLQRGIEEGRGKMKKMMGMMMMGVAMKMAGLIPIAIAGLFLLAGKALIVSKIALLLAVIIALKKILAQKQGGGHDSHGWQSGGGGGGGGWDRRSLPVAHNMAYRGQKPSTAI